MSIKYDKYMPLYTYLSPASIPQIVAHIQDYLVKHPILSVETIAEIIVQSLQEHPELINGEAIPISPDSEQSIKAYIDSLPSIDTYTKAEINTLLTGKQDTLTFDQAPTPGSSNPVTSSGIIAAMSALQSALETQINNKADRASTYTKTQVDTLLDDKANADDVYSKNTMDAKLLEVNTDVDNLEDELGNQSQQIINLGNALAYVENGDKAIRTYTARNFILWKGTLYTVNSEGIVAGNTIAGHVTAVTSGGLNQLQSDILNIKLRMYNINANETITINVGNPLFLFVACSNTQGALLYTSGTNVTVLAGTLGDVDVSKNSNNLIIKNNAHWGIVIWILITDSN